MEEHGRKKKNGEINNNDEELAQRQIRWDKFLTKMQQTNNRTINAPDAVAEEIDIEGGYYTLPVSFGDENHSDSGNPMRMRGSCSDGSLSTLAKRSVAAVKKTIGTSSKTKKQTKETEESRVLRMNVRRMSLSTRTSLAERDHVELYEKNGSSRVKWWHAIFFFSGISVLCCLCQLFLPYPYGLMMTSTQIAEVGIAPGCGGGLERCICPRETICATDTLSIILLALARCSAFFDYPLYMMMFLSKCHNINNVCRRTVLREWIDFGDMHKVHRLFGIIVGIETMFHSFFHMLRWGLNADIDLLWKTTTGISGLAAVMITPLICWPMVIPAIKERLAFEVRKGLHYLSIVWAIMLLFHSKSRIYYLIGIPALMYLVDYLFGYFGRNGLIENAFFERYGENGVALHFLNPPNWDKKPKTSYVYVMCPWISKYQWHAFTIFPEPTKEDHTMLCIESSGDWTKELHRKIKVPCLRPLYVLGPYKSPFSDAAVTTSNAIAVASGIGITPTLSLVLNYAGKKRINVVWACRDPGLVEYILHKIDIGAITKKSYAFIFYTGTRELALPKDLPSNIFIFTGRPHLEHTITGIVTAIHSGDGLPEEIYEAQEKIANAPFQQRMKVALSRVVEIYNKDEMFEYAVEETEKVAAAAVAEDPAPESDGTIDTAPLDDSDPETAPLLFSPDEVPEGQVSLKGLDSMISEFLGGIGEYSRSDIEALFHEIDSDGSGFIDRDEFDDFIGMITMESRTLSDSQHELLSAMERSMDVRRSSIDSSVRRSTHNNILGNDTTIRYMQNLLKYSEGDNPLEDWSIFYCGGSNEIAQILREVTSKYNIDFAVEKFDW
eukprot:CAMPEP_0113408760 /NCGR_PEP_ID=MMETSP0013_2-20120614/20780_1 /TAXON_ID=2843 ORGANISM="Skeletonema costatum, Strain 1716" /NCGR_SAMPLE_ID=MMETSP0013_2 /ASSEMBLY_ACC=CAM_ASM_000158 /LENGTH=835 /DNA_ID=CAMNT_0000294821 /DNA_START=79 /DNA_END=2586 /DNA_ORIENTATION=- /assembly_acc=CAM_ASM_000158